VPVLLVEQNVRAALAVADRAVLMAQGRVVRVGRPAELLDDPVVEAAYLGRKPA
jgi:branched-chain amino acid transport system ATP-binding protein